MRLTIRPAMDPEREIDLTHAVVAAIAQQIHVHCGGNEVLNWLEAERFLARVVSPPPAPRSAKRGTVGRISIPRGRRQASDSERVTGPIPYL